MKKLLILMVTLFGVNGLTAKNAPKMSCKTVNAGQQQPRNIDVGGAGISYPNTNYKSASSMCAEQEEKFPEGFKCTFKDAVWASSSGWSDAQNVICNCCGPVKSKKKKK